MRIQAIVIRIIQQFFRDKRTLGLMIVAPMFVLLLMSLVFNGEDYHPTVAVSNMPEPLKEQLEEQNVTIVDYTEQEAMEALKEKELDAFIKMNKEPEINLEGSDPTANKAVLMAFQEAMKSMQTNGGEQKLAIHYLYGSEDMELFDNFGPVLIGFFIFFFVFLISGVSFLKERTGGTLERLLATPLRRWEIVVGYVIGFGLFTTVQATLISWFSIQILGIMMEGSFFYVLLITFLLAMTALTLGTLLSAYANNELQMIQFIPIVVVPQVFFSGLFNMETMAEWLQSIGLVMPLTYGADALREIMIRGQGWEMIAQDVYILLAFSIGFMILNILALKKHRKL
ncbi:ABC transporter permease [Pseudalkalibacillus caeni]|uniref:ABC transporter permease n=1 Tax=Exobacillus caeni TaxID=2574798 RepID=A0A5R9EXV1_9BACL|nr:ABC transporter permease [Pseudalkalibacillus caeni]TLS36112.1 ABC transporter permease [Pseudalkalibacillus caeni]